MKPRLFYYIFFFLLGMVLFSCTSDEDSLPDEEIVTTTSLAGFEGRLPNNLSFGTTIQSSNGTVSGMNVIQQVTGTHVLVLLDTRSGWGLHVSLPGRVMPDFPPFSELQSYSEYLSHFKKGYSYELVLEILEEEKRKALANPEYSSIGDFTVRVKQNQEERYIHNFHDPVESGILRILEVKEGKESSDSGIEIRKLEVKFEFDVNMKAAYLETQPQTGKLKGKSIMKFSETVFGHQ